MEIKNQGLALFAIGLSYGLIVTLVHFTTGLTTLVALVIYLIVYLVIFWQNERYWELHELYLQALSEKKEHVE